MKKFILAVLAVLSAAAVFAGCNGSDKPDGNNNNNNNGINIPATPEEEFTEAEKSALSAVGANAKSGKTAVPGGATHITDKYTIEKAGDYYIDSSFDKKITVNAEGATLYLKNAKISNEKKVIESVYGLTITLIGDSTITNSNAEGSNAIDCVGDLTLNGTGSLKVDSTKHGIKANSISVVDCSLEIKAGKDGLNAEIDKYGSATQAPAFSNADGGYVYLNNAKLKINSLNDGIQADTFVIAKNNSVLDITTNGGAPSSVTEHSHGLADGKGIKAGPIDWGEQDTKLSAGDYLILIEDGELTLNSNDDAISSANAVFIRGGSFGINSGNKAIDAEKTAVISNGKIDIAKCYEGIECAKLEISGGNVALTSVDDGINASDGTENRVGVGNSNCSITISGGTVNVNSSGDGFDSNGNITVTGGTVYIAGPENGDNSALDADGEILINGGKVFAVGSVGMGEKPSGNSRQNVVYYVNNTNVNAKTKLTLSDVSGNELFSYEAPKACRSVIISCPELKNGGEYKIYGGGSELCSFTVSSAVTSVGAINGGPGGGPGGRPGGRG